MTDIDDKNVKTEADHDPILDAMTDDIGDIDGLDDLDTDVLEDDFEVDLGDFDDLDADIVYSEVAPDAELTAKSDPAKESNTTESAKQRKKGNQSGSDSVMGDLGAPERPYLPSEIIGGSIPYVPGTEEEAVWNAAAQASGTDRVHYCYTVDDGRVWYLATPSSSIASNPNSWCPLALALPGNSEFWDRETVHIYEQDGVAAAVTWDQKTNRIQVFSGPSRTILPRLQSMNANFVTIDIEKAEPVAWHNRALMQQHLSRFVVRGLFLSGLAVTGLSIIIWILANIWASVQKPDLQHARNQTSTATMELMMEAGKALSNDANRHITRIQELLSDLASIGGTLLKYELTEDGKLSWEALVPSALTGDDLKAFNAKTVGRSDDGRLRIRGSR